MTFRASLRVLTVGTALGLVHTAAVAQVTPGDQSGTPTAAGPGQSAATSTNAPAAPEAAPAVAPAARSSNGGPGDIIVTARRIQERLQDVPISITVFNQQQLTNRNVVQAQDLAAYTPSLSANNNFGSLNSSFAIRGFVQDIGTQPSVGVYFADVVSPRGASNNIPVGDGAGPGSFFDLQNVQILKGPQGTLFGRNTTGGAILLVPQKPTSRLEGYVEGSYGNYDLRRIQGVLNVPLSDIARFRIGVDHEDRDGYLRNNSGIGPSRYGDIGYTAVRASLVVDLTPDLENYTIVSYLRSDTVGDVQKLIVANGDRSLGNFTGQIASGQLARRQASGKTGFYDLESDFVYPQTKLTQWQIINTTTWRATDSLTVKNIASYAQLTEDYASPIFGTRFDLHDAAFAALFPPSFLPAGTYVGFTNATPIPDGHTADQSTFTEEFQLQGTSDKLNWQAGAYAELSDPLGMSGSQSPLLINCTDAATFDCQPAPLGALGVGNIGVTKGKTTFRNYGVYAQGTYALTETLKLTGGIRYTWDRAKNTSFLQQYSIASPGVGVETNCTYSDLTFPVCQIDYKTRSSKPTWLIDLDYKPTDDILVYAKYARGYRAGGLTPGVPTSLAVFAPEKVDAYEGGVKTQVRGPLRATFNVAGFYNNFSNQQIQVDLSPKVQGTVPGATSIQNAGKSRLYGAEVEASITPFDGFTLDVSYTYLKTKIKKVNLVQTPADNPYKVNSLVAAGDPTILSPKNKVSATATYMLPIGDEVGKVSLGATFTHTDKQLSSYSSLGVLAHRNLLNLNVNWNSVFGSSVDLSAFATNVTQKHYYNFVSSLYESAGFATAVLGEPRMFGGRIRYRFGGNR